MTKNMTYIADPGCNWAGNMELLKRIAYEVKKSEIEGSTVYLKPQLWVCDDLYKKEDNPYYQIQKSCELSFEQTQEIFSYSKDIKLKVIFSPFDIGRIRWCQELDVDYIKIANRMSTDMDFLNAVKETGIPPIISISKENRLPFYTYDKIFGKNNYKLLFTSTKYPSTIKNYPLKQIKMCGGLSNHIPNIYLDIASASIGCQIFEHHIYHTYINSPDITSSISVQSFREMINICDSIHHTNFN